jgi:hypothetical protein
MAVSFPLHHLKYSDSIQKQAQNAISRIFESANDQSVVMDHSMAIVIHGHSVQIGEKKLWFVPGNKRVVILKEFGNNRTIEGNAARRVRTAVKELKEHAAILNLVHYSGKDPWCVPVSSLPSLDLNRFAKKINKPVSRAAIVIAGLRKSCDIAQYASVFAAVTSRVASVIQVLGRCVAAFQMMQGCLSLLLGSIQLVQAIHQYKEASRVHDLAGTILAREQITHAFLVVAQGVLWLTLGVALIACPQAAIAYGASCLAFNILFYAVFAVDSVITLAIAMKMVHCIKTHHLLFEEGIVKNEKIHPDEKQAAARRFVERLVSVTQEEKLKISEKFHNIPTQFAMRMQDKLIKKRMIAKRLGIEENLLTVPDLPGKVETCFKSSLNAQKLNGFFSLIWLASCLFGIPIELLGGFSRFFKSFRLT